jgi:hypothetical protein
MTALFRRCSNKPLTVPFTKLHYRYIIFVPQVDNGEIRAQPGLTVMIDRRFGRDKCERTWETDQLQLFLSAL